jgi:hypothetical protein
VKRGGTDNCTDVENINLLFDTIALIESTAIL